MKPLKTKAQIRAEIEQQIAQYLSSGGNVEQVPAGASGNTGNANLFSSATNFEPRKNRTLVNDIIKTVDARKRRSPAAPLKRQSTPRKKLITDDFGEPVRWVWVDS